MVEKSETKKGASGFHSIPTNLPMLSQSSNNPFIFLSDDILILIQFQSFPFPFTLPISRCVPEDNWKGTRSGR